MLCLNILVNTIVKKHMNIKTLASFFSVTVYIDFDKKTKNRIVKINNLVVMLSI